MVVKATDYQLIAGNLYKMGADGILRRCVLEHKRSVILEEAHDGIVGGHYAGRAMTQNILCAQTLVADTSQGCKGILSVMRCMPTSGKSI
jgi:hypothetical protein